MVCERLRAALSMKSLALTILAALAPLAASVPAATNGKSYDLTWITGYWCAASEGEHIEEYWLPSRGHLLLGISRTTRGERTVGFEFMRIDFSGPVPVYIAQPKGGAPVEFKWSDGGADWARFDNPSHDFPQRIEYRRSGDRLHARVAGPGKGGQKKIIPFEYRQCGAKTLSDS